MEKEIRDKEDNQGNPLDRIKEIDELFQTNRYVTIEDEHREELRWQDGEDAKRLMTERNRILEKYSNDPDFTTAYAAYNAPMEGKKTAEHNKFNEREKERIKETIKDLRRQLKNAEDYLKKLEKE
ncbi:MAG: hypothetical protein ABSF55_01070 [Candidatus Staskawiczbacteria bacterium]|jgi:hypothetical protein